jgi:putative ABC transport system permease protein
VVGVAHDVNQFGIGDVRPQIYVPYTQFGTFPPQTLAVRIKSGNPLRFANTARQIIWEIDRDQPVNRVRLMDDVVGAAVANQRFSMVLLGTFSALAVLLASIGLYGVLSYIVTQRTAEMGLRIALGALPSDVVRLIIRQGGILIFIGIATGLSLALGMTQLLSGMLFGVTALDYPTFAGMAIALLMVGLVATAVPAYRASRIDPVITLRCE